MDPFRGAATALLLYSVSVAQAQQVLRLWPEQAVEGAAEQVQIRQDGSRLITDVIDPTLTLYLPDADLASGTAVIIAPGGAMRFLNVPA